MRRRTVLSCPSAMCGSPWGEAISTRLQPRRGPMVVLFPRSHAACHPTLPDGRGSPRSVGLLLHDHVPQIERLAGSDLEFASIFGVEFVVFSDSHVQAVAATGDQGGQGAAAVRPSHGTAPVVLP